MALLTHNRDDFLRLAEEYRKSGQHHAGIIIAVRRATPHLLAAKLMAHLNSVSADEMDDQVYVT